MDSILTSIKKLLGIESDYTHFDPDIIMYINSVFMTLNQLGVGPISGLVITSDEETWDDFIEETVNIEGVKIYIYLKVRLMFDPPTSSALIDAIERQTKEFEWRLNAQADES